MRLIKTTTPRKSQRQIKAPKRYDFDIVSYALQVAEEINSFEPTTYHEANWYSEAKEWMMAINEEMKSLQKKLDLGFSWITWSQMSSGV